VPETARSPHDRADGACGGAANRCYGKFNADEDYESR